MSKKLLFNLLAVLMLASLVLAACGAPAPAATEKPAAPAAPAATEAPAKPAATEAPVAAKKEYKDMTLCYPQLGAESDWRTANTASFKETAKELGVNLIFSDAQQKQENQISAMHSARCECDCFAPSR
jgi:ABC-type sugar transport system substrate-binding protein